MCDLENSLNNAIRHYRAMREHLERLENAWQPGEVQSLTDYLRRFEELQEVIVKTDMQLLTSLRSEGSENRLALNELQELMEDIYQQIKVNMPGLLALKELVATELAQVKGNRCAISNYQSKTEYRGRVVQGSF